MFSVEVQGLDALMAKFDLLAKQTEEAKQPGLTDTVVAWQTEDMHRKYPQREQPTTLGDRRETIILVSIWPRSRTYDRRKRQPKLRKGPRVYRVMGQKILHSNRPILRPVLYDKLMERMIELGKKAIQWP